MSDVTFSIISTLLGVMLGSAGTLLLIEPKLENLRRANERLARNQKNDF